MARSTKALPARADRRRALDRAPAASTRPVSDEGRTLPDPSTFSSGEHGTVGGKRGSLARLGDRGLDAWLVASGASRRIARLAAAPPTRDVLVVAITTPSSSLPLDSLRDSRHDVRIASG